MGDIAIFTGKIKQKAVWFAVECKHIANERDALRTGWKAGGCHVKLLNKMMHDTL